VHTRFSDSGCVLQDSRHAGFSPQSSSNGWSKSPFMCGWVEWRREGSLLLLLLCGGLSLACSSYSPISNNLYAEVAQQA